MIVSREFGFGLYVFFIYLCTILWIIVLLVV